MKVTATTQSNPQQLTWFRSTDPSNSSWYAEVRPYGWISQDADKLTTTLYFYWTNYYYNYYPYWLDSHNYSISVGSQSQSVSFSMPQPSGNGIVNRSSVQSITLQHDSNGEFNGTIRFTGYKWWDAFDWSEALTFPSIAVPEPSPEPTPTPEPTPEPPAPIVTNNVPYYYIYADGSLVYGAGIEGYHVLNPKLTLETNRAGSLTFDIPVGSEMYNKIQKLKTTVEARQGNEVLFKGRVINTKRNTWNTITYYCEGFLSWFVDAVQEPYTFEGKASDLLTQLVNNYNSQVSENRQIQLLYSNVTGNIIVEQKDYVTVWNEIKRIFVDSIGGYLVPYLTESVTGFQYLNSYDQTTSQIIQFGQNLLDFEEYIDAADVFTVLIPLGKETDGKRLTLTEKYLSDESAILLFGRIVKVIKFDDIEDESELRKMGLVYLRLGIEAAVSLSLKAVDLNLLDQDYQKIRLGNSVRVISIPHKVDSYFFCSKVVIPFSKPENAEFSFGKSAATISGQSVTTQGDYIITTSDEVGLKVMTFNVGGWYNGTGVSVPAEKDEEYLALFEGIFEAQKPDLLCIEEFHTEFTQGGRTAVSVLENYFNYIAPVDGSERFNGHCFCSQYPISNVTKHLYETETGRYYTTAKITVEGKEITAVITHLSADTDAHKFAELSELIDFLATLDSFILCGDYNLDATSTSSYNYIHGHKQFVDAGYNMANYTDRFGFFDTYLSDYDPSNPVWRRLDNIITSSDIQIESVWTDRQKVNDDITDRVDHIPLCAYVSF